MPESISKVAHIEINLRVNLGKPKKYQAVKHIFTQFKLAKISLLFPEKRLGFKIIKITED